MLEFCKIDFELHGAFWRCYVEDEAGRGSSDFVSGYAEAATRRAAYERAAHLYRCTHRNQKLANY